MLVPAAGPGAPTELTVEPGRSEEAGRWRRALAELPSFALGASGDLPIAKD